jgi:hypothetical protein
MKLYVEEEVDNFAVEQDFACKGDVLIRRGN